eukprot:TRINITY_DN39869_c0_g1_i1.p2 TRINITY_DN39869_c0_g1~~TRINITY_DN39869_c0_g1_i1.p2  ORF type:complete len:560 (+),score=88.44 TRINITY_DN39869_c0_g1_i1:28-1707(+)
MKAATFIGAILMVIVAFVAADLPIHCLPSQVAGTWEFELGDATSSTPESCGYNAPDKSRQHLDGSYTYQLKATSTIKVNMTLPDFTTSSSAGKGTWTMVFDEGFSAKVGDMDFFAFHAYKPKKGFTTLSNIKPENYISFCHKTLIGWYNKNGKFGCWRGQQVVKAYPNLKLNQGEKSKDEVEFAVVSPTSFVSTASEQLFDPDYSFIEMHNSDPESLWTAKAHEPFLSKTVKDMLALTGGKQFDKTFRVAAVPSSPVSAEEEAHYFSLLEAESTATSTRSELDAEMDDADDLDDEDAEEEDAKPKAAKTCEYGLPCSLDWRNHKGHNWLSGIRNQGSCGSCYAMAFMTSLESRIRIKYNEPNHHRYSPQHVLSCSVYNQGCDGGFPYLVGKHIEHFGAVSEKCFSYQARDGTCSRSCGKNEYPIENTRYVGGYFGACSEELMMRDIAENGPLTVAFEAPHGLFSYHGGIFTGPKPRHESQGVAGVRDWQHTNHAVVAIGWGETIANGKREKYWIIRNTWGKTWGENGYFRIRRGTNECGIEAMATTFTVKPKAMATRFF